MISYALREVALAGIEELYVVVNRRKALLWRYLASGQWRGDVGEPGKGLSLQLVEQPEPLGSGEALWRVREEVGPRPFGWLMPDFVLFDGPPPLCQLLQAFGRFGTTTVGVIEVKRGREGLYGDVGIVEGERLRGGLMEVRGLSRKRSGPLRAPSGDGLYKAVGRWILPPSFFDLLLQTRGQGEWDDTPALQLLCRRERVLGVILKGEGFDVGNPAGYRAALLDGGG